MHTASAMKLRVVLRDFAALLEQQMFFWGQDVKHPDGNLLCRYGFERRESKGLKGTSCYRKACAGEAFIELHGACAGRFYDARKSQGNFLYIRNQKRCFLYAMDEPPAPGTYESRALHRGPVRTLHEESLHFVDWWLQYEAWIAAETAPSWRRENYRTFASLPASRPSLPPKHAVEWLHEYRDRPMEVTRVRKQLRSLRS